MPGLLLHLLPLSRIGRMLISRSQTNRPVPRNRWKPTYGGAAWTWARQNLCLQGKRRSLESSCLGGKILLEMFYLCLRASFILSRASGERNPSDLVAQEELPYNLKSIIVSIYCSIWLFSEKQKTTFGSHNLLRVRKCALFWLSLSRPFTGRGKTCDIMISRGGSETVLCHGKLIKFGYLKTCVYCYVGQLTKSLWYHHLKQWMGRWPANVGNWTSQIESFTLRLWKKFLAPKQTAQYIGYRIYQGFRRTFIASRNTLLAIAKSTLGIEPIRNR